MSKLKEIIIRYDAFVNDCYDGGYASTSESAYIGELKNEIVKEARKVAFKELDALEIIIKKHVDLGWFKARVLWFETLENKYASYCKYVGEDPYLSTLTLEEFHSILGLFSPTDAERQ